MSKLFLFAHQDDEVAIAPRIAREVAAGAHVVCVFLTDGGAPAVRDAESRAVLEEMGVSDVHFVGLPDGRLVEHLEEAYGAIEHIDADEIVTLAWEGGHQDHDAAHLVALARGVRCLEFPLYHGKGLRGPFFRVMVPLHDGERTRLSLREVWRRARLSWRYPSQRWTWMGLWWPLLWRWHEVVCEASAERVLHPPHEGRLLYERRFRFPRERFFAAARPFIERRIVQRPAVDRLARD
jgi:hypothetical protein